MNILTYDSLLASLFWLLLTTLNINVLDDSFRLCFWLPVNEHISKIKTLSFTVNQNTQKEKLSAIIAQRQFDIYVIIILIIEYSIKMSAEM